LDAAFSCSHFLILRPPASQKVMVQSAYPKNQIPLTPFAKGGILKRFAESQSQRIALCLHVKK
jgi:hypothetical protein